MKKFRLTLPLALISFSHIFCQFSTSKEEFITKMFSSIGENYKNPVWLRERAILAAKSKDVDNVNIEI